MSKIIYTIIFLALGNLAFSQQEVLVLGETNGKPKERLILTGRVLDAKNNQPIPGAVLHLDPTDKNDVTDADGSFKLTMPIGIYTLKISFLGYEEHIVKLHVFGDAKHDFTLSESTTELVQVTVTETRTDENVTSVLTGVEQMSIEKLERQAKFLGETDVLRSLQSVTGVTSAGEGASGFNVRGGNTDENLILMDGNLVFNPVHALGFFSLFHPDMVQGITLYKGGVPAKYGGRLSSVLDVKLREGNDEKLSGQGGVGIASSRLVLEGPIIKNKASFIVGARASYVDWILKRAKNVDLRKSQAFFYDLTAKADARLTQTTKIGFTAFNTHDNFQFADEVKFEYATTSGSAYLRQLIGDKINITATANIGQYTSNLFDINGNDMSKFTNQIKYLRGGVSGFYQPANSYQLELGVEQSRYNVAPGRLVPQGISNVKADVLPEEKGIESSIFLHNQWTVSKKLELMAGIRYTSFKNLGPDRVLLYEEGMPKTEETIQDSLLFADGEKTASYTGLEPRFSLRLSLNEASSVKLGYNRSYQFFSQISNTASATPIDIWQLSNYHIKPQHADNFSIGYYQNFKENTVQTYLSIFYRKIDQLIDYKDFAKLLLNHHIETELLMGKGKAYGAELYFNKAYGHHHFEMNYTYSRTLRQVEANDEQEGVSKGEWYPSNYDKPHSLNLNYFWQIKSNSSFSVNFTYSTGRPTTAPVSSFSSGNVLTIPIYSERNQFRIPDYHRLDVAYTVGPWGKKERWRNSLTLSIYNLYFRKNAFSVFFRQKPFQSVTAYRVAVLGSIFPAITYDFKF
ncbi:MAG: TonB-dependent receptor plug domain-containing protein [Bacteroidetes bacterium]|nr:TonB-dependent receptor plug domain-containing protein [Bacteroidota bacterium]